MKPMKIAMNIINKGNLKDPIYKIKSKDIQID